ncbi:MAG: NUDIX hydrolase [Patescibacteria group bacterium]
MKNNIISAKKLQKEEIILLLKKYNIPFEQWGKGESKIIEYLFREIERGETVLTEENGELLRNVCGVGIDIYFKNEKNRFKLIETRQQFSDGRTRKRPKLENSVAEKIKNGEKPSETALRALKEELGLEVKPEAIKFVCTDKNIRDPQSFPGLKSRYIIHHFTINITPDLFQPEGYIENRKDLKSYWQWIKQAEEK